MPPSHLNSDAIADLVLGCERDGLELRLLDAAEITDAVAAEMLALFRASFGRWPWNDPGVPELDHLRWKISGPASRLGSYQGRIDGRLVYATTAFAAWARIGGARRLRVVLLDACVDPAYQARGIYSRAVAYRQHVLRYRCDFSMHERSQAVGIERGLARRGHQRLGNRVTTLSRALAPDGLAASDPAARRVFTLPRAVALWAVGKVVAATRRRPAARPRTVEHFDERFDALFEAAAGSFDLISERTHEFLSWRYGDPRAGRHVVRGLTNGNQLLGYAVSRLAGRRAYLADLLALPERANVIDALVADAVEVAATSGAKSLDCWLPRRHPYRASLLRQGFFDRGRDAGISYHAVEMPAAELRRLEDPQARVHFMLGDTDLV